MSEKKDKETKNVVEQETSATNLSEEMASVAEEIVEETNEEGNVEEVISEEKDARDEKIEQLQEENNVLADKVLRAQAELQNVQRRQAKEIQDLNKYRSQKLAESLLPVLDSLEQALKVETTDESGQSLKKGIEMAYENFVLALKQEGIEKVPSLGSSFDPTIHQAIQTVDAQNDEERDTVVQVFQEGYTLHERTIRPAMVVIAQ